MRRLRQSINQPRRQGSQRPQCPPNQPTPTRCPANQPTTPVTDCVDDTGNLVTRNPGEGKAWPLTFHGKTVTVTHPARLDTDPHLALRRLRHLALNQFKRTATLRHLHRPHLSHRPTLYRVRPHFTPTYASWLNQVELWFAKIERDVIARGIFTFVTDLKRKLMRYIRHYNHAPKSVKWIYRNPAHRTTMDSQVTGH